MKLYELAEGYQKALSELSEIEGLSDQSISDTLEGLKGELVDKARNVAAYFQNLGSNVKELKLAEGRIKARRASMERQSEGLKDYLRFNMQQSEITVIECPEFKVTLGKPSKVCNVFEPSAISKDFKEVVKTTKIDKAGLKKWMIDNDLEQCEGAEIVNGKSRLIIK